MSYKVEIIELEASKSSIKDFFSDLLNETKGFKQQITGKALLKTTTPMERLNLLRSISIQRQKQWQITFRLKKYFQEILCRTDVWINRGSGWITESIESQYILIYRLLSGSSYVNLPVELKSPRKGPINIENKDSKCFLWCHVRHINSWKEDLERIRKIDKKLVKDISNPEEITEQDKEFISDLDFDGIEFPV